ncbi:hypothetical protein Bca101_081240 [Brassica carinata]
MTTEVSLRAEQELAPHLLLLVTLVKACSVMFLFTVSFNFSAPAWTSYQLEFSFVVSGGLQTSTGTVVFSGGSWIRHSCATAMHQSSFHPATFFTFASPCSPHRGIRLGSPLFSFKSVRRDFQTNISRVQDEALHRQSLSPPPPSLLASGVPTMFACGAPRLGRRSLPEARVWVRTCSSHMASIISTHISPCSEVLLWGSGEIHCVVCTCYPSEAKFSPPGAPCLSTDDLHSSSGGSTRHSVFPFKRLFVSEGSVLWAWSNLFADYIATHSSPPNLLYLKMMTDCGDLCYLAKMLRISVSLRAEQELAPHLLLLVTLVKACSVMFLFTVSFNFSAPAWTSYQLEFSFVVSGGLQTSTGTVVFSGGSWIRHSCATAMHKSSFHPATFFTFASPCSPHRGIRLGSPLFSFKSVRRDFQTNVSRVQDEALHRQSLSPPPPSLLASGVPTMFACGAPRLGRRSLPEARVWVRTCSSHMASIISTHISPCSEVLLWGSGEIHCVVCTCYPSEAKFSPPGAPCLSTDDLHSSSGGSTRHSVFPFKRLFVSEGSVLWAWSNLFADYIVTHSSPPNLLYLKMMTDFGDLCYLAKMLRISGGFTGVFNLSIMSYFSFLKKFILPVGSSGLSLSLPYLLSMKGDAFSEQYSSFSFSLHTSSPSCVAVRTGSEEATKITSVFLVGVDWISTSLVTISQLSDFVLIKEDAKFPLSLVVTKVKF